MGLRRDGSCLPGLCRLHAQLRPRARQRPAGMVRPASQAVLRSVASHARFSTSSLSPSAQSGWLLAAQRIHSDRGGHTQLSHALACSVPLSLFRSRRQPRFSTRYSVRGSSLYYVLVLYSDIFACGCGCGWNLTLTVSGCPRSLLSRALGSPRERRRLWVPATRCYTMRTQSDLGKSVKESTQEKQKKKPRDRCAKTLTINPLSQHRRAVAAMSRYRRRARVPSWCLQWPWRENGALAPPALLLLLSL
mmetsp:Transcript_21997/g.70982  ORF Transcript_21997/g.70982 Transcript_21997/m.70982 type:complete len:248 (-) Transcript_21997:1024-1767(-)